MNSILILEDDVVIMALLRRFLNRYTVIEATSADRALRAFADADRQIDLLIADVTLPQRSGVEAALLFRASLPALPIILTSGYPVNSWNQQDCDRLERLGAAHLIILQKPFDSASLLRAIGKLLQHVGAPQAEVGSAARMVGEL